MENNNVWVDIKHPPVRKEGASIDVEIETKDGQVQGGKFRQYGFSNEWLGYTGDSVSEYSIARWRLTERGSYNKDELTAIVAAQQEQISVLKAARDSQHHINTELVGLLDQYRGRLIILENFMHRKP